MQLENREELLQEAYRFVDDIRQQILLLGEERVFNSD